MIERLTLVAPGYLRGSKTRAEAAGASPNKNGVPDMIQGYILAQIFKMMLSTTNQEKNGSLQYKIAVSAVFQKFTAQNC